MSCPSLRTTLGSRVSARLAVPTAGPLMRPRVVIGGESDGLRARCHVLAEVGGCWVSVSRSRDGHHQGAQEKG